ncbi:hypothetical protein GR160_13665 [Flavobacterium sp. Sd200]|uniref:hypothetical protein n=1 Tax=Flavobacterium sp. Sd200 TaxID=2692211 RepID=UPI00136DFDEB|nr:hypothetical protein [Flavobacterium sp. Sd200]MXN92272.1 hypothetical protein [Flavobacterium sp. Sd200]
MIQAYLRSLGSTGTRYLKYAKYAGTFASALTTSYSGYKVYNQYDSGGFANVSLRDSSDFAVCVTGLTTTALVSLGIVSNPVGWAIGAGVLVYGASIIIYDIITET